MKKRNNSSSINSLHLKLIENKNISFAKTLAKRRKAQAIE
jgi:hypothetical protein